MKNLIALIIGIAVAFILSLLISPLLMKLVNPAVGSELSRYICIFIGALVTGHKTTSRHWMWGGLVGIISVLILFVILIKISSQTAGQFMFFTSDPKTIVLLIGTIVAELFGGLAGGKIKNHVSQ